MSEFERPLGIVFYLEDRPVLDKEYTTMKRTLVTIAKGEDAKQLTLQVLRDIKAHEGLTSADKILIKPNYVNASHPSTGVTTSPEILEGIIIYLAEHGFEDITIGEGGVPGKTEQAFDVAGTRKLAEKYQLNLVNLNKDQRVKVKRPNALALKEVDIARTALDATCIISVPKLKVHSMAYITGGMKNMMGAIIPKDIMHEQIAEKIVDLASMLTPKLTIVDGIIGAEKDETTGNPVQMDLVIAGKDVVAVDAICASVMGINPKNVQHLQLAAEYGLGIADMNRITVLGEPIANVQREFELPEKFQK